ncbi:MAG: hypothetical protein BJ554DRAFT_2686, partial [Olpidium bornovanus]
MEAGAGGDVPRASRRGSGGGGKGVFESGGGGFPGVPKRLARGLLAGFAVEDGPGGGGGGLAGSSDGGSVMLAAGSLDDGEAGDGSGGDGLGHGGVAEDGVDDVGDFGVRVGEEAESHRGAERRGGGGQEEGGGARDTHGGEGIRKREKEPEIGGCVCGLAGGRRTEGRAGRT